MARLALVFAGGAALSFLPGHVSPPALLLIFAALAPIPASRRPNVRLTLVLASLAGFAAGRGAVQADAHAPGSAPATAVSTWLAARRGALARRIDELYGERAPLVAALTLAQRQGLDRDVREQFARSGTAHLLAISGFHVGVVAGVLLVLLRRMRVRRRRAALGAAGGAWLYVALLGFPDAATRAALILGVVAASRARGRPAARWGGLGTALLLLALQDPSRLTSPGFQLSFAGAAGLVAWARPVQAALTRRLPRLPSGVASAVAAGVAATVATLPLVAWHFERVSLVGIPATLLATPLVVVALPGALLSMAVSAAAPPVGAFLAGGVDVILALLEGLVGWTAGLPWASVWVPRSWVTVSVLGLPMGVLLSRTLRGSARRRVRGAAMAAAVVAWPGLLVLQARGTVELVMVDVGQGDAVAVRTPGNRWVLVDAGPPWAGDPGGAPVVRALRRRGVRRLEALVLTHPDLDHIGGAPAVLASFQVGEVVDPAHAVGKGAYLDLLEQARGLGVPWRAAREGGALSWDGVTLTVLHPSGPGGPEDRGAGAGGGDGEPAANDLSVVLSLRYGAFDALLTGDAPVSVERDVLPRVSRDLEVLKVGHHGSHTSTSPALLAHSHPRVALISVGRRNRYGHPHADVVDRLRHSGVRILRTDRSGTLTVLGRADGSFQAEPAGGSGR